MSIKMDLGSDDQFLCHCSQILSNRFLRIKAYTKKQVTVPSCGSGINEIAEIRLENIRARTCASGLVLQRYSF